MTDPALMVGPQDPDNTAELTARHGVGANAIELLAGVADNQPAELMGLLALPPDVERSDALVRAEVIRKAGDLLNRTETIDGEKRETVLASATVRGGDERSRVVTITYVVPSGRTGKASLGLYSTFTQSQAAYDEVRRAKMGLAAAGARLGTTSDDSTPPAGSPEAEALRQALEEVHAEVRELRARQDEPVEGFSALKAEEAKQAIADFDASQLDKAQAVEEKRDTPRTTVLDAVGKRREVLAQQQSDLAALAAARAAGRDPLAPDEPPADE